MGGFSFVLSTLRASCASELQRNGGESMGMLNNLAGAAGMGGNQGKLLPILLQVLIGREESQAWSAHSHNMGWEM
jgi:hypothetical protein